MRILSFNTAHDSSVCIINNGKLEYYCKEEAFSGNKRDSQPFYSLDYVKHFGKFDGVVHTSPSIDPGHVNTYETYARKFISDNYHDMTRYHHLCHASHAFYDSGFDESYCVVIDANGSIFFDDEMGIFLGREHETIFETSYPGTFKKIASNIPSWYGVSLVYALISEFIGLNQLENGKTMGLSAYGKIDQSLPPFFKGINPYGKPYTSIPITVGDFSKAHKNRSLIDNPSLHDFDSIGTLHEMYNDVKFLFENHFKDTKRITEVTEENYKEYANLAAKVQKESEDAVINFILDNCDFDACKNITLSGGYALNCLNNYRLAQELPPEVNLFIEPNADDAGVAIGAGKYMYYKLSESTEKFPLTNIYSQGEKPDYNILDLICPGIN